VGNLKSITEADSSEFKVGLAIHRKVERVVGVEKASNDNLNDRSRSLRDDEQRNR
jgi:hypothetical protein